MPIDEFVRKSVAVEHVIQRDAIESRSDLGGLCPFLFCAETGESRNEFLDIRLHATEA